LQSWVAIAALKTGSECSFTIRKLRFFACFDQPAVVTALRLALAASPTFFNSLLERMT